MSRSKGKIPRITFGEAQPINLTDDNWQTIEGAYGQPVPLKARAKIEAATKVFLQFAQAENTGLMKDAVQRVKILHKCARALSTAIDERAIDDDIRKYVDEEIGMFYARLKYEEHLPARKYVSYISLEVDCFLKACELTLRKLDDVSQTIYWPDGGAWEGWIRDLTGILKEHDLPASVRKDSDKTDRPSPFVAFLSTLQKFLPKEHIRSKHSQAALAVAIHNARRESKRPIRPAGRNTNSASS